MWRKIPCHRLVGGVLHRDFFLSLWTCCAGQCWCHVIHAQATRQIFIRPLSVDTFVVAVNCAKSYVDLDVDSSCLLTSSPVPHTDMAFILGGNYCGSCLFHSLACQHRLLWAHYFGFQTCRQYRCIHMCGGDVPHLYCVDFCCEAIWAGQPIAVGWTSDVHGPHLSIVSAMCFPFYINDYSICNQPIGYVVFCLH